VFELNLHVYVKIS